MHKPLRIIASVVLLIIIVLIESSILPLFPVWGSSPYLLLSALVALGFQRFNKPALWGAFLGGVLVDLFGSGIFGVSSLFFLVVVSLAVFIRRYASSLIWVVLPFIFAVSLLYRLVFTSFRFDYKLLFAGILSVGLMLIIYSLSRWVGEMLFGGEELQLSFKV